MKLKDLLVEFAADQSKITTFFGVPLEIDTAIELAKLLDVSTNATSKKGRGDGKDKSGMGYSYMIQTAANFYKKKYPSISAEILQNNYETAAKELAAGVYKKLAGRFKNLKTISCEQVGQSEGSKHGQGDTSDIAIIIDVNGQQRRINVSMKASASQKTLPALRSPDLTSLFKRNKENLYDWLDNEALKNIDKQITTEIDQFHKTTMTTKDKMGNFPTNKIVNGQEIEDVKNQDEIHKITVAYRNKLVSFLNKHPQFIAIIAKMINEKVFEIGADKYLCWAAHLIDGKNVETGIIDFSKAGGMQPFSENIKFEATGNTYAIRIFDNSGFRGTIELRPRSRWNSRGSLSVRMESKWNLKWA